MKSKLPSKIIVFLIFAWIVLFIFFGACFAVNVTSRDYIFRKEVRSHIENAYYSADPSTMRSELIAAKQGMQNLGLTEDLYGAWLPWDRTPDKQMKWQYKHIDSILVRIDEFESWESSQRLNETPSQQMQDVYTQKLDNIRKFIKEDDWSDWIAHDAFAYRDYFLTTVFEGISLISIPLIISLTFIILVLLMIGLSWDCC